MEELILALFMPTTYYDAWSLRNAMKVLYVIYFECLIQFKPLSPPPKLWQFYIHSDN